MSIINHLLVFLNARYFPIELQLILMRVCGVPNYPVINNSL